MHVTSILAAVLGLVISGPDEAPIARVNLVGTAASLCVLFDSPNVHKELGLSPEQAKSCAELAKTTRKRLAATYQAVNRTGSSADAQTRDVKDIEATFSKETSQALAKILTTAQLERLKQISLQSGTVATFLEPSVKEALTLNDAQVTAFNAIQNEARRTIQGDVRAGKIDRNAIRDKALVLRQEGRAQAIAMLSKEQKTAWDALIGKPFFLGDESPKDIELQKK